MTEDRPAALSPLAHPAGRMARLHRIVGLAPPGLTRAELIEQSHLDPEVTIRWWRAMGFPAALDDERVFSEDDLDIAVRLSSLEAAGLIDDDEILRLARVMGASFSRIAEAQVAAIDGMLSAAESLDHSLGRRQRLNAFVAGADENLLELVETTMLHVWRRHMLAAFARWLAVDDEMADAAVGFADISGFTKLSRNLDARELAAVVDQFEATSTDVVTRFGGRAVKLIGDEVMFACSDLNDAVDIALALVEEVSGDIVPALRAGVAFGPSLTLGGDVFGPTVNLASRLTDVARPSTVAITRETAEMLGERNDLHMRRVRRSYDLKGIGRTRIVVVRRAETPEDTIDEEAADVTISDEADAQSERQTGRGSTDRTGAEQ